MSNFLIGAVIAAPLILLGFFLPSSALIGLLEGPIQKPPEQLLFGARLFKTGLVALGFLAIVLAKLPVPNRPVPRTKAVTEPHGKIYPLILLALLFIAFILRLYHLGNGLWYDEIVTYVKYGRMPFAEILTTYDSENLHVLFALLANASVKIFGENDWSIRLPAVLFGVGSIWAIYLLGRYVGTAREGLLASAMLTFSYHHIWFSQNARGYMMLLFWTILSSWFFLRALREARPGLWLAYAVSAALGAYTHMTMFFVVAGQLILYAIHFLVRGGETWPEARTGLFYGFGLAALLTFQLYALVIPQILSSFGEGTRSNVLAWKNPLWTLLEFSRGIQVGFRSGIFGIFVLAGLFVVGAGIWGFLRHDPAFLGLTFIPVITGATLSFALRHPLWPRFYFFAFGFGVLVVVRGTTILGGFIASRLRLQPAQSVFIGTALWVLVIFASALSVPAAYAPKQDYYGALLFVEQNRKPGDAVVTVGVTTFPYQKFYQTNWEEAETLKDLEAIRSRSQRTWLLYTLPLHLQYEYPDLMKRIEERYRVVKEFFGTLSGGTIYVCLSQHPHP